MRLAVITIWTIGLIGAVPATLVILKLAFLVIYTLIDIVRLAVYIRRAAQGIAVNVSGIRDWPNLGVPASQLADGAKRIESVCRNLYANLIAL